MLGIGFFEIVIIGVAILIFVGPQKLPDVMRQAGKLFVQLRRTTNDVRATFEQVIHDAEQELRRDEIEKLKLALAAKAAIDPKTLLGQATGLSDVLNTPLDAPKVIDQHPAPPSDAVAHTPAAPAPHVVDAPPPNDADKPTS